MKNIRKYSIMAAVLFIAFGIALPRVYAAELKIAYVDIRRAFYEYEKRKTMETDVEKLTEERQGEHNKKVEEITKLRDEAELLAGAAKANKQKQIEQKLEELQTRNTDIRKELLGKKNDMFRTVVDDIQKAAEEFGKENGYDYILDSRNIMYAKKSNEITDQILESLNKK